MEKNPENIKDLKITVKNENVEKIEKEAQEDPNSQIGLIDDLRRNMENIEEEIKKYKKEIENLRSEMYRDDNTSNEIIIKNQIRKKEDKIDIATVELKKLQEDIRKLVKSN